MSESWEKIEVGQRFSVNPQRQIQRGTVTPFVPMDALSTNARKFERIDEREFKGSGQKFINGDTLIASITPCLENGKTAYVSGLSEGEVGHGSTEYIVLTGIEGTSDNLFAYYLARTPKFRTYAIGRMEGASGRQRVPATAISSYGIDLPPLAEQKAIASVLGAFDDKIENNRRKNETFEEMARAIFKSWFVDFDPVRAKMEGRPNELPDDISGLFPNELVDSEIGQIPKGWKVSKIKDQCERLKVEKRYSNKIVQPTGIIPVLDQTKSTIIGFHSEPTFISASFEEPVVTFANHTCNIRLLFNNFSVIQNVIPLRPVKLPTLWFYLRILGVQKFEEYKGHIIDFMDKNLCFPSFKSANALEQIVEPIFYKIESNTNESKTLAELRDTLLPKLISGEIRVKDAERKMETAI